MIGVSSPDGIWIGCCLFLVSWIQHGLALSCYNCRSTDDVSCGKLFKPENFEPHECDHNSTLCAVQQQNAIARVQVAAILRGCYIPGQLKGLNHSLGCREWTNPEGFAALYCFCDSHLCNSTSKPQLTYFGCISLALIGLLYTSPPWLPS